MTFVRIKFSESTCRVYFKGLGAERIEESPPWKLKFVKDSDPLEMQLLNPDDYVKLRALCKWSETGKLILAIGLSDKDPPKGFDIKKEKIVLLTLELSK